MKKKVLLLMLALMFISTNVYAVFSFFDNGDGTVTDERTGLIWLKDAGCYGFQNWEAAVSSAGGLNSGECSLSDGSAEGDWRLPSLEELQGIGTDPPATWGEGSPTETWTTPSVPFLNVESGYWSSTNAGFDGYVYAVFMSDGSSILINILDILNVWPVKDCLDIDQDGMCDIFEEACCLTVDVCAEMTADKCESQGGLPQGGDTTCAGVECEVSTFEGCCLPSGTCSDVTFDECEAQGGVPQGEETDCSSVTCEGEPDYDLSITSVQVIQVVEDPRLIVANKPAAIKVSIMSNFPDPVTAPIEVQYNFGKSSYVELGPDLIGVTLKTGINTFYIPGGPLDSSDDGPWLEGPPYLYWETNGRDDGIKVTVDPDHTVYELNLRNNIETINKDVMMPIDFRVLVAPVVLGDDDDFTVPADAVEQQRDFMLKTYPLASLTFTQQALVRYADVESYVNETAYDDFVFDLSTSAKLLGYNRVAVVVDSAPFGGSALQMLSEPEDRIPVVLKNSRVQSSYRLTAHEIGHTFYLWHPHSSWFNDLPALQDYKYSVTERDYGDLYNTFMSYEPPPQWNDKQRYCDYSKTWFETPPDYPYTVAGTWQWNLQSQFKVRFSLRPVWLVRARLFKGGPLDILPWYKTVGLADLLPIKNYQTEGASVSAAAVENHDDKRSLQIVLLDDNQQQLEVFPFNVSFRNLMEPDFEGELIVVEQDVVPFHFNIPVTANTALIQIVDEIGIVLGQRAVTPNAPEVQLQNPNGGENILIGSKYSMCWSGTDQDGDTLQYFLAVSPDGGNSWLPISSDEEGPCLMWDTTNYAPGSDYLVKVIATDGINTGEDISDSTFSLVVQPPDDDGDGFPNDEDNCLGSDTSPTVIIDGCDSGIENQPLGEGCKMSDQIEQCALDIDNHGTFVSCVAQLTNDWKEEGLISGEEKGKLQECAAGSLYGKIITAEAESVTVALSKLSCGSWLLYATTSADAEGMYSFCNVPDGTYKVEADHGLSILSPEVYNNIIIPKPDSFSLDFIETVD